MIVISNRYVITIFYDIESSQTKNHESLFEGIVPKELKMNKNQRFNQIQKIFPNNGTFYNAENRLFKILQEE